MIVKNNEVMNYIKELNSLGGYIVIGRKLESMTQKQLAASVGINVSGLNRLEKGKFVKPPSFKTLCKIAGVLNLDEKTMIEYAKLSIYSEGEELELPDLIIEAEDLNKMMGTKIFFVNGDLNGY